MKTITFTKPDDYHTHLREDALLRLVLPDTYRRFARVIVMPNLKPPVTTVALAQSYYSAIKGLLPKQISFEPLMTLYLTDNTSAAEIRKAHESDIVHAVKYYPAGATTNSDSGVTNLNKCAQVFETMQQIGLPLLIHGEVTDPTIDIFDREKVFIERHLRPLLKNFPELKIVFEHITTAEAAQFVTESGKNVAATITPHHLLLNRNAIFAGGIRPHHYCLPVLKRETHRTALIKAATSGNPKFFLGTDSAPHAKHTKENACGCAGIYNAYGAIELYAEIFERENALDKLEGFASFYGADFYGLPRNKEKITLSKENWQLPTQLSSENYEIVPFRAGEAISWKLV
jgi:dihydroorotase